MCNEQNLNNNGLTIEKWEVVEGFPNYSVSNLGRVRNDTTNRIVNGSSDGGGYIRVKIKNEKGESVNVGIHRMVAKAFVPNPQNKSEVDHIDADKSNNVASNLKWCTRKENMRNPITKERHAEQLRKINSDQEVLLKRKNSIRNSEKLKVYNNSEEHKELMKKLAKKNSHKVEYFIKESKILGSYESICAAARALGCNESSIRNSINSGCKCRGYYWRRAPREE